MFNMDRFKKFFYFILIFLSVFLISTLKHSLASEIKPCNNCALIRLVNPFSNPILNEKSDYDHSMFEMIYPSFAPKQLKGLSPAQYADLESKISFINEPADEDIIASYDSNEKKRNIKYADLQRMILSLAYVQNNTEAVKLMTKEQKLKYLHDILKTNLLFEEGSADLELKKRLNIPDEEDYNRFKLAEAAFNETVNSLTAEYRQNESSVKETNINFNEIAVKKISRDIELSLETSNILLLKKIDVLDQYTGETSLKLCTLKNDSVSLNDVKKKLSPRFNGGVPYKKFKDEEFIAFIFYESLFEAAYSKYLLRLNKKYDFQPYSDFLCYTISEALLTQKNNEVKISEKECEEYFQKNEEKFRSKEKIIISYIVFDNNSLLQIKKSILKAADFKELLNDLKSKKISFEFYESEGFYKGQLSSSIENFLYGLKAGGFSAIAELGDNGSKKYAIFSKNEIIPAKKINYKDIYPLLYRQTLADKKARTVEIYFSELFKKYNVTIFLK